MPMHLLPPERAARVRELHRLGRTVAHVAIEFDVSRSTAGAWHRMLGLKPNPPPNKNEAFWTDERLDKGRRLAAEVGINTATSRELGCSVNAFAAKADARGWPRRDLRADPAARAAEAKRLAGQNIHRGEIAERLGVQPDTVRHYLRDRGNAAPSARAAGGN